MDNYTLFFDGSCGPKNPGGIGAFGYTVSKAGQEEPIASGHGVIGSGPGMTNNLAEFWAVAKGMEAFLNTVAVGPSVMLSVYGDSKLVIQIMSGHWRAKPDKAYYPGYHAAEANLRSIRRKGVRVSFDWIPRESNQRCDGLSKAHQKVS